MLAQDRLPDGTFCREAQERFVIIASHIKFEVNYGICVAETCIFLSGHKIIIISTKPKMNINFVKKQNILI